MTLRAQGCVIGLESRRHMPLKLRRFLDFAAPQLREALEAISATHNVQGAS